MKWQMERRELLALITQMGGLLSVYKLSGCGPVENQDLLNVSAPETITMKDIVAQDRLSRGLYDILYAKDIAAWKPVTLYIDEGSHKHAFVVGPEEFQKLIKGESLTMKTEIASGHSHTVVINPKNHPSNAKSAEVPIKKPMPDEEPPEVPEEEPLKPKENPLKVMLEGEEDPMLFLSTKEDMVENSAEYCAASEEICSSDPKAWMRMQKAENYKSGLIYKLNQRLNLKENNVVHLRVKKDNGFIVRALRILKKND